MHCAVAATARHRWYLVRGSTQHRAGVRGGQRRDVETITVDRYGHEAQSGACQHPPKPPAPRVLHRQHVVTVSGEFASEQYQTLGHSGDDQDTLRCGHRATDPRQVGREVRTKSVAAERVAIAEVAIGEIAHRVPGSGHPLATREQRQVGPVRAQVELDGGGRCRDRRLLRNGLDS